MANRRDLLRFICQPPALLVFLMPMPPQFKMAKSPDATTANGRGDARNTRPMSLSIHPPCTPFYVSSVGLAVCCCASRFLRTPTPGFAGYIWCATARIYPLRAPALTTAGSLETTARHLVHNIVHLPVRCIFRLPIRVLAPNLSRSAASASQYLLVYRTEHPVRLAGLLQVADYDLAR